jgi:hypothetical protein
MEQKKVIGNVNVLDLRKATQASVVDINRIGNVNILVHSRETVDLITRFAIGNINNTLEIASDVNLHNILGPLVINKHYFKYQEEKLFLLIMGPVTIEPDVTVDDVKAGLGKLIVMGPLVYPAHLSGIITSEDCMVMGPVSSYPVFAKTKMGSLDLDESYLHTLEDGTELTVVGSLRAVKVLPNDLLERKVKKLFVLKGTLCHAENGDVIRACLVDGSGSVEIIPTGFERMEKPLVLDGSSLDFLPSRKLFCIEWVEVKSDVTPAALDKALDGIQSKQMILCPAALKEVMSQKCNLFENRVIFYEGDLWFIDDSRELQVSRFNYLEGKATLVVQGELRMSGNITPEMITSRITRVHNLGIIWCTPEQMGAIDMLLGLHEGTLIDSTPKKMEEDKEEVMGIGNVNYLAL